MIASKSTTEQLSVPYTLNSLFRKLTLKEKRQPLSTRVGSCRTQTRKEPAAHLDPELPEGHKAILENSALPNYAINLRGSKSSGKQRHSTPHTQKYPPPSTTNLLTHRLTHHNLESVRQIRLKCCSSGSENKCELNLQPMEFKVLAFPWKIFSEKNGPI